MFTDFDESTWPLDVAQILTANVTRRAFQKALLSESPKMRQWLAFRLASIVLPKALPFGGRHRSAFSPRSAFRRRADLEMAPFLGGGGTTTARRLPVCSVSTTATKPSRTSLARVLNQSPIRQKQAGGGWGVYFKSTEAPGLLRTPIKELRGSFGCRNLFLYLCSRAGRG